MKIIDISWPITSRMTHYKNKATLQLTPIIKPESSVRETLITLNSHCGTHVDAPLHFLPQGKSIDALPLESLIGPCRVLDYTSVLGAITQHDLEAEAIEPHEIILVKTRNSFHDPIAPFDPAFIYLKDEGAHYLAAIGIKAFGIDYLGVEHDQPNHPSHKALLGKNIPIIEGLRLAHVEPGRYMLVCLPLAFQELDASPARAILLQESPL